MAIRPDDKKVQDNMDYKTEKEKMQDKNRIKKVDVFNLKDYLKYKEAVATKVARIVDVKTSRGDQPILHTVLARPQ